MEILRWIGIMHHWVFPLPCLEDMYANYVETCARCHGNSIRVHGKHEQGIEGAYSPKCGHEVVPDFAPPCHFHDERLGLHHCNESEAALGRLCGNATFISEP